jgi:hypothetical protein
MADALEDLLHCEHDEAMWDRARQAWQAYVDWADGPPPHAQELDDTGA